MEHFKKPIETIMRDLQKPFQFSKAFFFFYIGEFKVFFFFFIYPSVSEWWITNPPSSRLHWAQKCT
jgi:hypothetical protein